MELPVCDIRRFAEAMEAAEKGEVVTFVRDGRPVLVLTQAGRTRIPTADEALANKRARGSADNEDVWPADFDDPAFSRKVLGSDG